MTTWTPKIQITDSWTTQYIVLYLLTELSENILDETGDLVVIDRGGIGVYTEESDPNNSWSEESIPVSTYNEEVDPNNVWA